jgi:hypothetical protein
MSAISKAERHAFTVAFMATVVPNSVAPEGAPFCTCSERSHPHPAHIDELMVFKYHRSLGHALQRKNPTRQRRAAGNLLPKKARTRR